MKWNSGYTVKGRTCDAEPARIWYGEMKHPVFKAIERGRRKGQRLPRRPLSDRRQRAVRRYLCLAPDRPEPLSRAAGVRHIAVEIGRA